MNRRGFMKFLGLGVAGIAVEQAIPLGRVWSFPTEIVIGCDVGFGTDRAVVTVLETFIELTPKRVLVRRVMGSTLYEVVENPGATPFPFKIIDAQVGSIGSSG